MTKKQKLIIIIVSICLAVALLTTAIVAIVINSKKSKTATGVMTCDVNPQVQFILNGKDEVMKVVALNNDGYAVTTRVDFIGLDAEDAAKMFVKISTEAGYINAETTGTKVKIDLSGEKKSYNKLKNKITDQVNNYFDENGIIAGAVTTVTKDLKGAIKVLKPNALNIDDKNAEELMNHYLSITNMISGLAPEKLEGFYSSYNSLIDELNKNKSDIEDQIAETEAEIADYKTQLQESGLTETEKTTINTLITQAENAINFMKQGISDAETEFNKSYSLILNNLKKSSEKILKFLETEISNRIDNYKAKLLEHKTNYSNNKAEIDQKIADFRASLEN